jgi:lipopolysaccharide biosynthesis regulator YciM
MRILSGIFLRGWPLLRLLLLITLLLGGVRFIFQDDWRDQLRAADRAREAGQSYQALQSYLSLQSHKPQAGEVGLRIGIVRFQRGEYALAISQFYSALSAQLSDNERDLVLLYLGQSYSRQGHFSQAEHFWQQIKPDSDYLPLASLLAAEQAFQQGDYPKAMDSFQAGQNPKLALQWWQFAQVRVALLTSIDNPERALELLVAQPELQNRPSDSDWTRPLLPDTGQAFGQLLAILRTQGEEQIQQLGQFLLQEGLPQLALRQFERIPSASPLGQTAQIYRAYAYLQSGQHAEMQALLQQLRAEYPEDSRIEILQINQLIAQQELSQAQSQLEALEAKIGPSDQVRLARANIKLAERDYLNAALIYRELLMQAAENKRGEYALLVAKFHYEKQYEVCTAGLDAIDLAASDLPDNRDVQSLLAGIRLACNDPLGAEIAARDALASGQRPDASYYLAMALLEQKRFSEAEELLIELINLVPNSNWRQRAEEALLRFGPQTRSHQDQK